MKLNQPKARTIEQYHVLKWIESNFVVTNIAIEIIDRYRIKITDMAGERAVVTFISKNKIEIVWGDVDVYTC